MKGREGKGMESASCTPISVTHGIILGGHIQSPGGFIPIVIIILRKLLYIFGYMIENTINYRHRTSIK